MKVSKLRNLLSSAPLIIVGLLILIQFFSDCWLGELATSFQLYYFIPLGALFIFYIARKTWRLATTTIVLAVLNFIPIAPLVLVAEDKRLEQTTNFDLSVVQVNVENKNRNFAPLISWLKKVQPDIFAVQELTEEWDAVLKENLPEYQRYTLPRPDYFGIGIYSKTAIQEVRSFTAKGVLPAEPALVARVACKGGTLVVAVIHTLAPHRPDEMNRRNEQLTQFARLVGAETAPRIVLADLNTVPWSNSAKRFANFSGMRDSREGLGFFPTCLIKGLLWVPIDYCWVTPGIKVRAMSAGPNIGSDHVPLLIRLGLQ